MDFDGNFRAFGEWDIQPIQNALPQLDDPIWLGDSSRQTTYSAHRSTTSVFVSTFPLDWDGAGFPQTTILDSHNQLGAVTWPLVHHLENLLGGRAARALYVLLPPQAEVGRHKDFGLYLSSARRIHVPIWTNQDVIFNIAEESMNMAPGQCIEINNMRLHWVRNGGVSARVHLICDIVPNNRQT